MSTQSQQEIFASFPGSCPICKNDVVFTAKKAWLRDSLLCPSCPSGSIPRERAVMVMIDRFLPNWRDLAIHESSPGNRGLSVVLKRECKGYVPTQYFPGVPLGQIHNGVRCEDLEKQTFPDASFDLVVTQDVMEHVFDPAAAYREIARTLKPGGLHIHTTPIYKDQMKSSRRAELRNGEINYLFPPEYHGNPVGDGRSLVTWYYGHDFPALIASWAPVAVEVTRFNDPSQGLVAEFLDVIVCRNL